MRKTLYLYGFLSVSFLFSKTFEFSKNLVNYDIYQDSIQVKSPVSTVVSGTDIEVFDYDNFGNLTKDKDKSYVYNDFGQISRIKFNDGKVLDLYYDDFGRLSNFGSASFDYNDFNMMSSFKDSAVNAEYFYDDKTGYRSSKIVNGIEYTFDLDDRGRLLRQTDSLGNVTEIVWNGELPETLTFNGKTYNFICNDHGDVTNLVLKDGELVNSYEYDIYGKVLSEVESVPNPIRYAHEYYDSESKLYYLRGRYYNPDTKSFTTADPAEADAKLYAYTGYDPINFIDPSGYMIAKVKKSGRWERAYYVSGEDAQDILKYIAQELKIKAAKKSLPKPLSYYISIIVNCAGGLSGAAIAGIVELTSSVCSAGNGEILAKMIKHLHQASDNSKNKFAYIYRMNNGVIIPCLISKSDAADHNLQNNPDDKYELMSDIREDLIN